MADPLTILKAKATGRAMSEWLDVEPDLDIQDDYVRIYYPPSKLKSAQKKFSNNMNVPGRVRVDLVPVMSPYIIERYGMWALAALFGLYMLAKK